MKWIQRKRRERKGKERGKRVKRKRGVEGGGGKRDMVPCRQKGTHIVQPSR